MYGLFFHIIHISVSLHSRNKFSSFFIPFCYEFLTFYEMSFGLFGRSRFGGFAGYVHLNQHVAGFAEFAPLPIDLLRQ